MPPAIEIPVMISDQHSQPIVGFVPGPEAEPFGFGGRQADTNRHPEIQGLIPVGLDGDFGEAVGIIEI